jgi:hypothetical protein
MSLDAGVETINISVNIERYGVIPGILLLLVCKNVLHHLLNTAFEGPGSNVGSGDTFQSLRDVLSKDRNGADTVRAVRLQLKPSGVKSRAEVEASRGGSGNLAGRREDTAELISWCSAPSCVVGVNRTTVCFHVGN